MDCEEYFSLFVFKVEPCPQKNKHPWDSCNYCHPQENARRRDVRKYRYLAEACPDYKAHGYCVLGNDCPFAHGVFEINLHPSKYRTQMCTEGNRCCRKMCFFAHNSGQLRHPDYSYGYRNAAEAEIVKDRLLTNMDTSAVQPRSSSIAARALPRLNPAQIGPDTPPQHLESLPTRFLHREQAGNVVDAFRTLPAALPPHGSGFSTPDASYPLYDLQGAPGWNGAHSLDAMQLGDRNSSLAEMLPMAGGGSVDLATTQFLRNKLNQQTRSLPLEGGPRISMKVRRELGLEPPSRSRANSLPGVHFHGSLPNALALGTLPAASGSLPSSNTNMAIRNYVAGNSTHKASILGPAPPSAGRCVSGVGASLPPVAGPLRVPSPVSSNGSLKVISPTGVAMSMEEALTHLGMGSPVDGRSDLGLMASALGLLNRLGYSLASESSSPTLSDCIDRGQISGQSTPEALCAAQNFGSFGQQLGLSVDARHLLPAAAAPPGLAALSLSAVDTVQCT